MLDTEIVATAIEDLPASTGIGSDVARSLIYLTRLKFRGLCPRPVFIRFRSGKGMS